MTANFGWSLPPGCTLDDIDALCFSFEVGQVVQILVDCGGAETVGVIDTVDPAALPGEDKPYRVSNLTGTECLGWFSEEELEEKTDESER